MAITTRSSIRVKARIRSLGRLVFMRFVNLYIKPFATPRLAQSLRLSSLSKGAASLDSFFHVARCEALAGLLPIPPLCCLSVWNNVLSLALALIHDSTAARGSNRRAFERPNRLYVPCSTQLIPRPLPWASHHASQYRKALVRAAIWSRRLPKGRLHHRKRRKCWKHSGNCA